MSRPISIKVNLAILFTILFLAGCSGGTSPGREFQIQDFAGRYGIDRVEPAKTQGDSLVYGWIEFDARSSAYAVNISCVALAIDEARSEKIYIDSVAHVIPTRLEVVECKSKFQVYWLFSGGDYGDSLEAEIVRLESLDDCGLAAN
jgi:hypothetical protein